VERFELEKKIQARFHFWSKSFGLRISSPSVWLFAFLRRPNESRVFLGTFLRLNVTYLFSRRSQFTEDLESVGVIEIVDLAHSLNFGNKHGLAEVEVPENLMQKRGTRKNAYFPEPIFAMRWGHLIKVRSTLGAGNSMEI
jgi:hypothetical protein